MSSAWLLQKALFARLEPVLAGLTPPVPLFDEAPAGQSYPFAELSRHVMTPDDGYRHYLTSDVVAISVYSDHGGKSQVLQVMAAIRAELTDATLALEDGTRTMRCRYERADTARDADGRTHIGTIFFSILFRH